MVALGRIPSKHKHIPQCQRCGSIPEEWEQGEISLPKPGEMSGNKREGIVASLPVVEGTELPVKMDLWQYLGFMTNYPWNEFILRQIWWWPDLFQRPPWILDFHIPGMKNVPKSMDRYNLKHKKFHVCSPDYIHM